MRLLADWYQRLNWGGVLIFLCAVMIALAVVVIVIDMPQYRKQRRIERLRKWGLGRRD